MHVGAAVIFQSHGSDLPDRQIYANDLSLVDLVEPLGYESIWSVEHHFTDYTMCPDVYQFLSPDKDSPSRLFGPGSPLARSAPRGRRSRDARQHIGWPRHPRYRTGCG